jgi:hypothetical protein
MKMGLEMSLPIESLAKSTLVMHVVLWKLEYVSRIEYQNHLTMYVKGDLRLEV